jgi:acetyl esterase/lipase
MYPYALDLPSTPLWDGDAPGAQGGEIEDRPAISVYLPENEDAERTAVIICPGGAYQGLANDHEGLQVAKWLNSIGIVGIVLRYRLGPKYHHPIPMLDIQRAIRTVRYYAQEWRINPDCIGVWGFSAGGHLAATSGTMFDVGNPASEDSIEKVSCRPDFMVLAYAVITLEEPFANVLSRANLLGENADPKLVRELSLHNSVRTDTPPTFLFHTDEDTGVPAENSVLFYLALRQAGVPAEMHIYCPGEHGLGMADTHAVLCDWTERLKVWLQNYAGGAE